MGSAGSLHVIAFDSWAPQLNREKLLGCLSSKLIELDLAECHDGYTDAFRLSMINASPALKVLAVPACFFASPQYIGATERRRSSAEPAPSGLHEDPMRPLTEAFEKPRLETFFMCNNMSSKYTMISHTYCGSCRTEMTSANLINLKGLTHLRELNVFMAYLKKSAHEKMANRNLRTVRLDLFQKSDFCGLPDFAQRCPKLTNLKLRNFCLPNDAPYIAEALGEMKNLKRLCLSTSPEFCSFGSRDFGPPTIPDLPPGLELIHTHNLFVRVPSEF